MEQDAYEPALWSSGRSNIDDFTYRSSGTVSVKNEPLVPPALLGQLPRFHFMAHYSGQTYKGILPFLDAPTSLYSPRLKREEE